MKKNIQIIAITFLAFIITSCEKVIQVNIDEADKEIVIEGEMSTEPSIGTKIRITKTKNYNDLNNPDYVAGAFVTITNDSGRIDTLNERIAGEFFNRNLLAELNRTYTLKVLFNGKTYSATSTVPAKIVTLDTLTVDNFVFGGKVNKTVRPSYKDPQGVANYYRFIQYQNNKRVAFNWAFDDDITDGRTVTRPFINRDGELKSGDTVRMEMMCIDKNVYQYWFTLNQNASGNNSPSPSNPTSNIIGGALGVFSANTYHTRTVIIP